MNCWHCNTELIWQADHDLEDVYGTPQQGTLTHLICPNESCKAFVEISLQFEEEVDEKKES